MVRQQWQTGCRSWPLNIAGKFKDKGTELITDCNAVVKQAQSHSIKHTIWKIAPKDIRFVTFADSAFDPNGVRHQQGWLIGVPINT